MKTKISCLPLPPPSLLLTNNLTADPLTVDVSDSPSVQRRARLLPPQAHFAFVSPFPLPFPYDIQPPGDEKASYIEQWLSEREPRLSHGPLKLSYPQHRDQPRHLIGLSPTGLNDCLPHLDVGDAFSLLGTPSLTEIHSDLSTSSDDAVAARTELIDVLSGHAMLSSDQLRPWSLRYSGHQFGTWAGQLGDGRAISVHVTPHPDSPSTTYELQLKGSGRTPFSRAADGLAVVRSSIREFLCSEAMNALRIPTTRSLSLISLPSVPVARERIESACILTRIAPSFIRIGSFEALNPPTAFAFFGGGQQPADYDALRILGEWVAHKVLKLDLPDGAPWGKALVLESARRNARMVAAWQAYGFMHGVINTDNVSIMGLTIDYGPYAFMDVFDRLHICNHTDDGGRYAYREQPSMIVYALRSLLTALAPLIGAEVQLGERAVSAGWFPSLDQSLEKIDAWRKIGLDSVSDELEKVVQEEMSVEYGRLMRLRLGVLDPTPQMVNKFESKVSRPLLDLMEDQRLDFHATFRTLSYFDPAFLTNKSEHLETLISKLLSTTMDTTLSHEHATKDWLSWLETYSAFLGTSNFEERKKAMLNVNPRFVLRQWLLEEVIKTVEEDEERGKRILAKVLEMSTSPFSPWGAEEQDGDKGLSQEIKEERRFCSMGEDKMLGFQCSCSS